jgi:hypothetical protein
MPRQRTPRTSTPFRAAMSFFQPMWSSTLSLQGRVTRGGHTAGTRGGHKGWVNRAWGGQRTCHLPAGALMPDFDTTRRPDDCRATVPGRRLQPYRALPRTSADHSTLHRPAGWCCGARGRLLPLRPRLAYCAGNAPGEGQQLHAAPLKLALQAGGLAQLRGAHGRVVLGVREQDAPAARRRQETYKSIGHGASHSSQRQKLAQTASRRTSHPRSTAKASGVMERSQSGALLAS